MSSILRSMWLISVTALLAVNVRTGALQHKDMEQRRCNQCIRSNLTTCEQPFQWSLITCPSDQPYCATIATGPDFDSTLSCISSIEATCILKYSSEQNLELTCTCNESTCNMPFSRHLVRELISFSRSNITFSHNEANLTKSLFKFLGRNLTSGGLYKEIVTGVVMTTEVPFKNYSNLPTASKPTVTTVIIKNLPRAEAQTQDAHVPSDDDEDEGEGSGSFEETRSRNHQPSAPAAPSSFLPANENSATSLCTNLLLLMSLLVYLV